MRHDRYGDGSFNVWAGIIAHVRTELRMKRDVRLENAKHLQHSIIR